MLRVTSFGFENLDVWQKAVTFAKTIYAGTRNFPSDERFSITSQLRRAAISIPSNIAEGSSRGSKRDFARFVEMAYGSLMEVVAQATIAHELGYLDESRAQEIRQQAEQLARMLSGLRSSLVNRR